MTTFSYRSISIFILIAIPLTLFSQIPNPGFEQWTIGNPDEWFCSNLPPYGTPVTQITPGHNGSWAVRGEVITNTLGDTMLPLLTSGLTAQGFPVTSRHPELKGYYKLSPIGGDIFLIGVLMYNGNVSVGSGIMLISEGASDFTQFTVPINYPSGGTPDRCVVQFAISNSQPIFHPGSYFVIDDLSLSAATNIDDKPLTDIPEGFKTFQNYPNPFNTTTTIRYSLLTSTSVRIEIFDVTSQLVSVLADGFQEAGYYTIPFNARQLPSGFYYYRLETESFSQTRRMLLTK